MSLAGMELETKRARAFRLLRGEDATESEPAPVVAMKVEPDVKPTPQVPMVRIDKQEVIDPKWGRECLACHEPKPWDLFHADNGRKSGKRSRCNPCVAAEKKARDAKTSLTKKEAREAAEKRTRAETESRTNALERLAEMHSTQFAHLLYSEQVRLGVTKIREAPRATDYRQHRSWASTKS